MRLMIKHNCECDDAHFQFLKDKLENAGFEVLNKNVQCMTSELLIEDLEAIDYIIDFQTKCFIHQSFVRELRTVERSEGECFENVGTLYINNDMGIMASKDKVVRIYTPEAAANIFNTSFLAMMNYNVVAVVVDDNEFLKKIGTFHKEMMPNEMLKNGYWTI